MNLKPREEVQKIEKDKKDGIENNDSFFETFQNYSDVPEEVLT